MVLFLTVLCILTMGLVGSISLNASAIEDITAPTWENGDSWSMGFYEEMDENDLLEADGGSSELSMFSEFGSIEMNAELGLYQTLTVVDTADTSTGVDCYKVKVEQYYGAIMDLDVNIHMTDEDLGAAYGDIEMPDFSIDIVADGYFWLEMDNTGFVYFTVEDLAIAREEFDIFANADMDLHAKMNYNVKDDGSGTADYYADAFENIELDMTATVTDMAVDYSVDFEPALDVFDFPIMSYESWSASSDMTITLDDLSGTIVYDFKGNIPDEEFEPQSGTINLGEGLTLPDVYGPVSVVYYFENLGSAGQIGSYDDAVIISGSEDYYGYNNYYYYYTRSASVDTGYGYEDVYEEESSFGPFEDFEDFSADDLEEFNPMNMFIVGNRYYSPSAGMIVSTDMSGVSEALPGEMSDTPFGFMEGAMESAELKMEPVTESEVAEFKNNQRPEMEQQYEEIKAGDEEDSSSMMWLLLVAVVVVIVLVLAAFMVMKKKKAQSAPPGYYGQPQYGHYGQYPPQPQQQPQQPQQPNPPQRPPQQQNAQQGPFQQPPFLFASTTPAPATVPAPAPRPAPGPVPGQYPPPPTRPGY